MGTKSARGRRQARSDTARRTAAGVDFGESRSLADKSRGAMKRTVAMCAYGRKEATDGVPP